MSTFNEQTITIPGGTPGQLSTETYGTLREAANSLIENADGHTVEVAFQTLGPKYIAASMRGMMRTVLALVDEVERLHGEAAA